MADLSKITEVTQDWPKIIEEVAAKGGHVDRAFAERVIVSLAGYSKRSDKKATDVATISAAFVAYHRALVKRGL